MTTRARALNLALQTALLFCACDTHSPDDEPIFRIDFIAPAGTTFTATLDGRTYTRPGKYTVRLKTGVAYEIVGTFTGGALGVRFSAPLFNERGGVQRGSIQSSSGTVTFVNPCDIAFGAPVAGTYAFQVQFQTTATPEEVCTLF